MGLIWLAIITAALGMTVTNVTHMNKRSKKLVDDRLVLAETKSPRVKKTDKYRRNISNISAILTQSSPTRETFGKTIKSSRPITIGMTNGMRRLTNPPMALPRISLSLGTLLERANFKVPRYVKFVHDFPMTGSGKVKKFELREQGIQELGLTEEYKVVQKD